jgi:hypothetical protein
LLTPGFEGSIPLQVLAGIGLAAAAGLRAFLPPLLVGVLARLDLIPLRDDLQWLASTPVLIVLGTAVILELLGDKIPVLDHGLDVLGTVLKPASGALMLAAPLLDLSPAMTLLAALLVGGTVAGTVHLTKSGLRLASTGTTAGLGNPALSLAEDGLSASGTLLAVFAPLLLLLLLVVGLLVLRRVVRWMQTRARPPAALV